MNIHKTAKLSVDVGKASDAKRSDITWEDGIVCVGQYDDIPTMSFTSDNRP
jgi:hypothetical protein